MVRVETNFDDFEYDIHSLVKAFFPREDVVVATPANPREDFRECMEKIQIVFEEQKECGTDADSIRLSFQACAPEKTIAPGKAIASEKAIAPEKTMVPEKTMNSVKTIVPEKTMASERTDSAATFLEWQEVTNLADRKLTKDRLKQGLYRLLCNASGQDLPWGSLTGIRPAKIPMKMLEEGKSEEEIYSYMRETYFASDEKIGLALAVAKKEREILSGLDAENGYSLYVGIPFCPTTCAYCSFTSYPLAKWAGRVDEYLEALEKEIRFTGRNFDRSGGQAEEAEEAALCIGQADENKREVPLRVRHLDTVYIGGGTPTTLSPAQLDRLLTMLESNLDLSAVREFTVEAGRPDSITREKLSVLRAHGISRISINPQTMQQKTLNLIGRRHTVEQTKESFLLAREMGFFNINMDLIVGLPEESIRDVEETLQEIERLAPDNLTVHSLAIKRAARLRMQQEDFQGMQMENTWETIALTAAYAKRMGLVPYYMYRQKNMAGNFENVGYAKPGYEGLYNILIMEEKQTIMALGAGAITKFVLPEHGSEDAPRIVRAENVKDISNYLDRIDEMVERKRRKMEELGL